MMNNNTSKPAINIVVKGGKVVTDIGEAITEAAVGAGATVAGGAAVVGGGLTAVLGFNLELMAIMVTAGPFTPAAVGAGGAALAAGGLVPLVLGGGLLLGGLPLMDFGKKKLFGYEEDYKSEDYIHKLIHKEILAAITKIARGDDVADIDIIEILSPIHIKFIINPVINPLDAYLQDPTSFNTESNGFALNTLLWAKVNLHKAMPLMKATAGITVEDVLKIIGEFLDKKNAAVLKITSKAFKLSSAKVQTKEEAKTREVEESHNVEKLDAELKGTTSTNDNPGERGETRGGDEQDMSQATILGAAEEQEEFLNNDELALAIQVSLSENTAEDGGLCI